MILHSNQRFKKFFSFYKPYKLLFLADTFSAFMVAVVALLLPLCIRYVTQAAEAPGVSATLFLRIGAVMVGLILLQTGGQLFYDYMGHAMGAKIERDMRRELFTHYQKLPFRFYDTNKTGQLMSRMTNDLLNLAELYHHGPEDLIIFSLKFLGALGILLYLNPSLTAIICCFLPVMMVYSLIFNRKLKKAYRISREKIGDVNDQLEDNLAGIRVVKSFANEKAEVEKFQVENEAFYQSRASIYKHEAYYYTGMETFFTPLITAAVVVFGGMRIAGATLSVPDFLAFVLYVGYLTAPIPQLAHTVQLFQNGITGFNRFMDIMEQPTEPVDEHGEGLIAIQGAIEFNNISFRYREGLEDVLQNLSLKVSAGEYIALVGTSGVGKSTLCSLLPRFYEVTSGKILLDGRDIRNINLQSLRRNIGTVQQDVYLFAGTVCENILYGRPEATREEVVEAAKKANAHDFIMALPQGYDTDVGQRGVTLSGGQKQRISIARVFLKNPGVLILDEATSALDLESEKAVHESLTSLAKGRTTFVIAHRLSTVRNADRILVLTGQGISEQGTHQELMEQGGYYAKLCRSSALLEPMPEGGTSLVPRAV